MSSEARIQTTVGELLKREGGSIKTGPFGTALKASEYSADGVPLISVREIGHGAFHIDSKTPRVSPQTTARLPDYLLEEGDIVFARKGGIERCALINREQAGWFLGSDGIRLRPPKICDARFLAYSFQTRAIKDWLIQHSTGSTMASLNQATISRLPIDLPSLQEQSKISDVLEVFDSRIVLLRETNATLEAIAQALFKAWFVDFDPVRAKSEGREPVGLDSETAGLFPNQFESSEGGLVPKGWKYESLKNALHIFDSQRVPLAGQERAKRKGPYPYYGAATLMDYVDDYLFDGIYLLLGEDGSVVDQNGYPITQYVWGKIWVNNHAHVLQGTNGVSTEHLLLSLKRTNVQPYVTGAVQAKISQANMWRIPFLMPNRAIAEAFGDLIGPLFAAIRGHAEKAQTLAELRDTLLPRLISGQLRLSEAEALLQDAA